MAMRDETAAHEDALPPGARHRLRMQREREAEVDEDAPAAA
jgi:hypothetical protein